VTLFRWLAIVLCPLAMGACASITEGTTQTVAVTTTPKAGAKCQLQNEKGNWTVPSTPGSTLVVKADGPLSITCTHPDGDTGSATVKSSTSLGTFGNVLIGGVVGVAVDLNSGAAYIYPPSVTVALNSSATGSAVSDTPAPAPTADAAAPPPAPAATTATAETIPAADLLGDGQALPGPVRRAAQFCRNAYQDARLDPLRDVIALDAPPTLAMQSNAGTLTASQRSALDAYQPLHDSCRDRLIAANAAIARALDGHGVGNRDFLSLYQGKSSIGDFNRAQAEEFERLKTALLKIAVTPPPPAAAVPAVYQPAPQANRPLDYCQGLIEASCMEHLHRAPAAAQ
jgi:hypothetical protein